MIKQGGYAKGCDYLYYRKHGWRPIGAAWMVIPTLGQFALAVVVGVLLALVLP